MISDLWAAQPLILSLLISEIEGFRPYPRGFSSNPPSPPSPLPPEEDPPPDEELLSSDTNSKTILFGPPLVVAMLSFASRRVLATLKRILTRSIFSPYNLWLYRWHGI